MNRLLIVASVAVVAMGGTAYALLRPTDERVMKSACIDVLKDRLKSPSSFRLINISPIRRSDATWEEFQHIEPEDSRQRSEDLQRTDPQYKKVVGYQRESFDERKHTTATVTMRYEAENSFGASLADIATCKVVYATTIADEASSALSSVAVDGYTKFDWTLHSVAESQKELSRF